VLACLQLGRGARQLDGSPLCPQPHQGNRSVPPLRSHEAAFSGQELDDLALHRTGHDGRAQRDNGPDKSLLNRRRMFFNRGHRHEDRRRVLGRCRRIGSPAATPNRRRENETTDQEFDVESHCMAKSLLPGS